MRARVLFFQNSEVNQKVLCKYYEKIRIISCDFLVKNVIC